MGTLLRTVLVSGLLLTVDGGFLAADEPSPPAPDSEAAGGQQDLSATDDTTDPVTVETDSEKPRVDVDIRRLSNGKRGFDVDVRVDQQTAEEAADSRERDKESYLGLTTARVPPPLTAQIGHLLGQGQGLLVVRVLPDSPAQQAGIQPFDVVTALNGNPLNSTHQLKKLVLSEEPGNSATLAVVRAATPQSVEVIVGQRPVPGGIHVIPPEQGAIPLAVRVFGRDVVIDKGRVVVPGARIRWGTRHDTRGPDDRVARRTINVSTKDGKNFKIEAHYFDKTGNTQTLRHTGTVDEILEQTADLPKSIREDISGNLESLQSEEGSARSCRLRFRPGFRNGERSVEVHICRCGDDGEKRVFDFSYCLDDADLENLGQLLDVDDLAEELKHLSDEVRTKLESTLRDFEVPPIQPQVEDTQ